MNMLRRYAFTAALFGCLLLVRVENVKAEDCTGVVDARWLDDGRKMKLLANYVYTDPNAVEWLAAKEWVVDGASIPMFAWSFIGGPFEGKYRKASVSHDVACDQKSRPWRVAHRMFYDHMLCSGVSKIKAQVMYWAVFNCGPRWGDATAHPFWCSEPRAAKARMEETARRLTNGKPVDDLSVIEQERPNVDPVNIFDLREPESSNDDFKVAPRPEPTKR